MHWVVLVVALIALIVGPGLWVKAVMQRYQHPANRYAKTGGQVARELLDSLALRDVRTETTEAGDHYDPQAKAVRLSADNFNGRSLTAIAVAAHEVGHAIQDARGFGPLKWRTRLVHWVSPIERIGAGMLMISPFTAVATQSRALAILTFFAGLFARLGRRRAPADPADRIRRELHPRTAVDRATRPLACRRQAPRPPSPHRRRVDLRVERITEPAEHRPLVGHPPPLTSAQQTR